MLWACRLLQTATLVLRCQHRRGEGITDDWDRERDASRPALGSHKSAGGTAVLAGRRSRVCSRPAGCSNLKAAVVPGVASAGYAYYSPRGEAARGQLQRRRREYSVEEKERIRLSEFTLMTE